MSILPNGIPRRAAMAVLPLVAVALAVYFAPEGRLACSTERMLRETSPDGAWTLTLCCRPMWFSMPGGSSDAPGWIVLRDRDGAIRGVSDLAMVQMYGSSGVDTEWTADRVSVPLTTELPLVPAAGPFRRWLDDRVWRWRALFGFTPTDDEFH